ncbi:bifunctional demethylmenaquinone methyltransferase/2-methoxy-6-polyprenyl-1,4-benzoquinol methylase UbiE [bacterium]|nr:bifunctional demethylmenaquinone methyltransferase/2-methoxy-6-polyprenyl-1,4-benzoquinol methylase UbiE [bacterium]
MALDEKLLDRDPDRVARMFTEISPRYDLLNRLLSMGTDRRWRRTAVRMVRPEGARRILDLASGTGDLAFEFLRHPGFEGEVLGLDFSTEMVRRARKKAAARKISGRAQFRSGDALDIPEPDGYFDLVSVGFGVRNFVDLEKGLLEAHRVLAPGGRLLVLEFFRKKENPLVAWYLDHILPRVGRWISGSPSAYAYLRRTKNEFLSPDEFTAILHSLGFRPVVVRTLTAGIAHAIVATKPAETAEEAS